MDEMLQWLAPISDTVRMAAFGVIFIALAAVCLYGIVLGDDAVQNGRGRTFLGMPTQSTVATEWKRRISAGETRTAWVRRFSVVLWIAAVTTILWPSAI